VSDNLTLKVLRQAVSGSAAAFRCVSDYQPAGGPGDKVFPPTYESGKYATETRRIDGKEVFGFTSPLITTSDGAKMGKTAAGAVWLNEDQLSAYDYWQFWRNTHDGDVGKFLRLFTDLPLDEIARLESLEGAEINHAKVVLATEATKLCRGAEAAVQAQLTAQEVFEQGRAGEGLPRLRVTDGTIGIVTALTVLGFCASNGEARRKIGEGAVRLNDLPIKDERYEIVLDQEQPVKISLGKKRHGLLERG